MVAPDRDVNPLTVLAVAIVWFVAATIWFDPTVLGGILAITVTFTILQRRVAIGAVIRAHLFFALAGLGLLQANLLFHESAGWYARSLAGTGGVGESALRDGLTLMLRAVVYGSISFAFVTAIDPAALVRALMQHARMPPFVAFSIMSALQLMPGLGDDYRRLRQAAARRARGRAFAAIAVALIAGAIRRASRAAIAMEARGLSRESRRTSLRRSAFSWSDGLFIACAVGLLGVVWSVSR